MSEKAHFEVSDDGQTDSPGIVLHPYGEYDKDKQLTPQQVIDMKRLFKNEGIEE